MSRRNIKNIFEITFELPILPGSISTVSSQCGKPNCACKGEPPILHGPYYRWTGLVDGKRTTRTISKEVAKECKRRIKNYRNLEKKIKKLVLEGIKNAPWQEN